LRPLCEKEGLGVINYFPLAAGFLSGKYRSAADAANSSRARMVTKYLNDRGYKILGALDQVREKIQCHARAGFSGVAARESRHHRARIVSATKTGTIEYFDAPLRSSSSTALPSRCLNQASA